MSTDVIRVSSDLAGKGEPFAVATVVRVEGSSSARPGAKAVIDHRGKVVTGWIGGGCAESAVRQEALKCIENGRPQVIVLDMTDELLGVGMPCGGVMHVYIEPVLPKPELLIVGHGRIVEILASLGRLMNFYVIVDDPCADPASFRDADRLITDDLDLSIPSVGPQSYVVIATQHKADHIWLQKALETEAAYIALISSRHRAGIVLDYLAATGVPAGKLQRVWAPAGLDLGATCPEEIALSIMSQIVALRRGRNVPPLKAAFKDNETEDAPEPVADKVVSHCDLP